LSTIAANNSDDGRPAETLPRHLLQCGTNPNATLDYLIAIDDCAAESDWLVALRYVPDKLVLEPATLAHYIKQLMTRNLDGPEGLALAILEDINNETIPRWVEVACASRHTPQHRVLVEDRQPNWDNSALLARLTAW